MGGYQSRRYFFLLLLSVVVDVILSAVAAVRCVGVGDVQ